MLEFRNVTKKYSDGNISLENINFEIDDGEFVFIVGNSGAGKSTIVRMILNIDKPTHGDIYFNNLNVSKLKGRKLAYLRRQIGVVFQDFKLLQQKTVYENIAFVLEVSHEKKINIKKKVNDVLDLVGLSDKAKKFPAELSGGEQQRVAIARALVNDPLLLIADEPTGNLDAVNAWDTFQLINKVNNWGTSVIVVTHDSEIVDALQKRVIFLEKGVVVRDSVGGYNDHKAHAHKKIVDDAEEFAHHQDKFPNPGENYDEFRNRKKNETIGTLGRKEEKELEEIYENFDEKEKEAEEVAEKARGKRIKIEKKHHVNRGEDDVDDDE